MDWQKSTRRSFLGTMARRWAVPGVLGAAAAADGTLRQRFELVTERITVPIRRLPSALQALRIVQLTDLHYQPWTQLPQLREAVAAANALRPDLIVLTGDYVTTSVAPIYELAPVLGTLTARLGVFAVLGNHDYRRGDNGNRVAAALEAAGITLLRNAGVTLSEGGGRLFLAGLESCCYGDPNLKRALRGCDPDVPAVVLMHEPDFAEVVRDDPRVVLQLSGHSHGGQIRLPGSGALHTPWGAKRYTEGLYQTRGLQVYVSRGIGCTGLPLRLACPPELTHLTLAGA